MHAELFGIDDGLRSEQGTGLSQRGAIRTRDGRLWFATLKGVATVDLARVRQPSAPPVTIERVTLNEHDTLFANLPRASMPTVPAGPRNLSIHYTSLGLRDAARTTFKVKLEGFDQDWVTVGSRRVAYYTNLPPGHYQFSVAAIVDRAEGAPRVATLAFQVAPFFYETVPFRLLVTFCLAGGALLLLRFRATNTSARPAVSKPCSTRGPANCATKSPCAGRRKRRCSSPRRPRRTRAAPRASSSRT